MADLASTLKTLSRLAPGFQDVILYPGKTGIKIYVATPFAQALFNTDVSLELDQPIQLKAAALNDALTKRSNVDLSLDGEQLKLKDKTTTISLQTESAAVTPPSELDKPEGLVEVSMSTELFNFLGSSLPTLKIEKIHDAQQDFRLFADFSGSITTLAVFDAHQMAFIRVKQKFDGIEGRFNLPYERFAATLKDSPTSVFRTWLGEDTILLRTKQFQCLINTPPSEGLSGDLAEAILGKIKSLAKFPSKAEVKVDLAELQQFLGSCRAVATDDARLVFETKKNKVKIQVVSATGSAEIIMPNKAESSSSNKFAVEIKLIKNMTTKCSVDFHVFVSDDEIFLKGTTSYVGQLSEAN